MRTAYDIIKAHYDASERGDLAAMVADVAPDARWTEMDGFPRRGTYIGGDAVVEGVFKALGAQFEEFRFTLERLLDAGDDIIGIGTYSGRNRETGKSFNARTVHVWHVSGDSIDRFEQFTDTLRVQETIA